MTMNIKEQIVNKLYENPCNLTNKMFLNMNKFAILECKYKFSAWQLHDRKCGTKHYNMRIRIVTYMELYTTG